ncbi:penicillin acylase family protein [Sulfobacillus harzensis]|uniref:Penicillin acylase family protein n=1 Tax=Sulfobacillus harzensis TaxID=2729629 RepID=A0A7Y0L7J8_9FIRM|nr:penicillin acylase family protein [Sulfobacillus harzensis]NMP24779.1 penicillin acylase family protein [Sulfobacillus harzensis]
MTPKRRLWSLILAIGFTALVLDLTLRGVGPLPPLASTFNPATGIWTNAKDAQLPTSQRLVLPGLHHPVTVSFGPRGTAYIKAQTDHDLFLAIGYVQAKNRLFQMDLMRRQGEGLLSQVVGKAALGSDRFELQLGLLRTARANWAALPPASSTRAALLAYSAGVNDLIKQDERQGTLPEMFKLLNYRPAPWTPIDTLVIQGDMTQDLDYTTAPIEYNLLQQSLGPQRASAWVPVDEPNTQHPYDLGPYLKEPLTPMESTARIQTPFSLKGGVPTGALPNTPSATAVEGLGSTAGADNTALKDVAALTQSFHHAFSDSNNWAVSGAKTANGQPMLAGDPHLSQTLPSIWYQLAGQAPGYDFTGVSIPGTPMILIGRNHNIAWSLTNVQNQATFFYREKINPKNRNQYFWDGAWRTMKTVQYTIPVKGQQSVNLTVKLTVHGPMMTQSGETLAVDWIGALPSPDISVMLSLLQATNFSEFQSALSRWHAPGQNFIYADRHGNIGLISAGYYAEVKHGQPWTVLSGTGADDVSGTIPYNAVPQSYDPASGFVFSANQREVSSRYPYYVGTSMDFFSTGFRADQIYDTLKNATHLTPADFARLQSNKQDVLAQTMVPEVLHALKGTALTTTDQQAAQLMSQWNGSMGVTSPQATIWWFFINQYLQDTFGPWWNADHVPVKADPNLALATTSEVGNPLVDDLEAWTAHDPTNPAFSLPSGQKRTAAEIMAKAFQQTVRKLAVKLGSNPRQWQWGRVHAREFPSLAQIAALGYGPRPSGGDSWTVDAADGGLVSSAGPSWRMIVNWQGPSQPPQALGVYPGGQSENPLSLWYQNRIQAWWSGQYAPIKSVSQDHGGPTWHLVP